MENVLMILPHIKPILPYVAGVLGVIFVLILVSNLGKEKVKRVLGEKHQKDIDKLNKEHGDAIDQLKKDYDKKIEQLKNQITDLEDEIKKWQTKVKDSAAAEKTKSQWRNKIGVFIDKFKSRFSRKRS